MENKILTKKANYTRLAMADTLQYESNAIVHIYILGTTALREP